MSLLAGCGGGGGGGDSPEQTGSLPPPPPPVASNRPPILANPVETQHATFGTGFAFDVAASGMVFSDPDGDALSIRVSFESPSNGLLADRASITGVPTAVGTVSVVVQAADGRGGTVDTRFAIEVRAPALLDPKLPATPFKYADAELDLPPHFRPSAAGTAPFGDNTPADNPVTNEGATLGRVLFYDRRLSVTDTVSCASCHEQSRGFAVGTSQSMGFQGGHTRRNAMALTNARYYSRGRFLWDERAASLEQQVLMPIEDPIEMGFDLEQLEVKLAATQFYPGLFEAAFGTAEITRDRIARALAQFVRSLVSYRSKFDSAFTDGVPDFAKVFTSRELLGAQLFGVAPRDLGVPDAKCAACHIDLVQIGREPQNNGLDFASADPGAGGARFKTPSLRNIAVSSPYMHDGRFPSLRLVVRHYDSQVKLSATLDPELLAPAAAGEEPVPLQLHLTEEQKDALVAFLETLTDASFLTDPKFSDPFTP
jgi:cytochrome c peroxidase